MDGVMLQTTGILRRRGVRRFPRLCISQCIRACCRLRHLVQQGMTEDLLGRANGANGANQGIFCRYP